MSPEGLSAGSAGPPRAQHPSSRPLELRGAGSLPAPALRSQPKSRGHELLEPSPLVLPLPPPPVVFIWDTLNVSGSQFFSAKGLINSLGFRQKLLIHTKEFFFMLLTLSSKYISFYIFSPIYLALLSSLCCWSQPGRGKERSQWGWCGSCHRSQCKHAPLFGVRVWGRSGCWRRERPSPSICLGLPGPPPLTPHDPGLTTANGGTMCRASSRDAR